MITKATTLFLACAAASAAGAADEKAPPPRRDPGVPVRLHVVFSKHHGERRLASWPYTISMTSSGEPVRLRMGIDVPLRYESKDIPGNVIYKSVGNRVDCRAEPADADRIRLLCTFEQSSLHDLENPARSTLSPPMLRTFSSDAQFLLRDGESGSTTAGTDPVTGETLKIDVTLNVVKSR